MPFEIGIRGCIVEDSDKWIYDWFGETSVCPEDVRKVLSEARGQPVNVLVNSYGGSVFAGSEIYTNLMAYTGEVNIRIDGLAASAASVVAMGGRCAMSPTSQMMIHNVSTSVAGDYRDMDKTSETLRIANQTIASAYSIKSGMALDEALAMMDEETWMTAQEAKDKGLIDEVLFIDEEQRSIFANGGLMNSLKNSAKSLYACIPILDKEKMIEAYNARCKRTEKTVVNNDFESLARAKSKFLNLRRIEE